MNSHEDILDHSLLVLAEAFDLGFRNMPVVFDFQAEVVVVRKANDLALLRSQGIVERFDDRLGLIFRFGDVVGKQR